MLLLSPFQRQFLVVAIKHVLKLIFQIWIAEISRKFCAKRFCDPNLDSNRLMAQWRTKVCLSGSSGVVSYTTFGYCTLVFLLNKMYLFISALLVGGRGGQQDE